VQDIYGMHVAAYNTRCCGRENEAFIFFGKILAGFPIQPI
jgi:hypothetical protein